ncbi:gliding motility-associated C-terminal domain-containing protein [Fluviicola sp.]|uniref:T9SS type B sorting domain-containing protein n=1 Tax=Fluviicola sp. TaxID=1917219 RepID=UPI0031CFFBE9
MIRVTLLLILSVFALKAHATHVMGGEITWKCTGNGYVFQLVFYRDCNGVDVNPVSENLSVWNHSSVTSIPVLFVSRTDISPNCTQVPGSPNPLACGSGANGGNGVGAVEKIIYRSNPVILSGVPPAQGWIITYSNFSRNGNITNLVNPTNYGVTIRATMYAIPGAAAGVCSDNSPQFLQDPYLVLCAGENYEYNMHPVDEDLDSVVTVLAAPMDRIQGTSYNPPSDPDYIPYEAGFSATSPTPDATFNAGNVPLTLDPQNGHLSFRSFTIGGFVVKVIAQSYRKGVLIAEVEREMQLIVTNCPAANNAPVINGPFGGLFETTVNAGTLVNFTLTATDVEFLQDGTPQSNYLIATGTQFGTNYTSTSGCDVAPCATLNQTPVITGVQGVSTNFSWQTDCAHLIDAQGNTDDEKTYTFVFRVQDNFCQIPKTTFKTITIHVKNPGIIPPTKINCISTLPNGTMNISWDPVSNPNNTFVDYELYSVQNGLIGNFPIGTTTTNVPDPGTDNEFYILVKSGCNVTTSSDTVKNVHLDLLNPANGTAVLDWNLPAPNPLPGMDNFCTIYREYPTGTWTSIAVLPYNTVHFVDTIDICSAFLNYQVAYSTPTCQWSSNIIGDLLQDDITPQIPIISSVSVDTLTGNVVITWNENYAKDTYGYIVYHKDANGFIVEIDTVWGRPNTTYTHPISVNGPETYSIAAFDSCFTPAIPPTYQTSAKAEPHTSSYLTYTTNSCTSQAELTWTAYGGWGTGLTGYTVFVKEGTGSWVPVATTTDPSYGLDCTPLVNYSVTIRANNSNGTEAFSNIQSFVIHAPSPPAINYLRVATVDQNTVVLRHEISVGSNVQAVRFEKFDMATGQFALLGEVQATASTLTITDADVDVDNFSYTYRAIVVDSCGNLGATSNRARTILLKVTTDQTRLSTYLNWSPYGDYDGGVLQYLIYRGIDGNYPATPTAVVPPDQRYFEDLVDELGYEHSGKVCYFVVAEEATDQYGIHELSFSNDVCAVIEPLVYVPNAFTPGGLNPIFIPVVSFQDVSKYEFSIVDRWGQLVFQTNDPAQGWDGHHQQSGKLVAPNVYVYVLKVVDGNNQEYFFRGNVTVIH